MLQMVWLESPTNPLLKLIDIQAVADTLRSRRLDIILIVDNTFLTCYFQVSLISYNIDKNNIQLYIMKVKIT